MLSVIKFSQQRTHWPRCGIKMTSNDQHTISPGVHYNFSTMSRLTIEMKMESIASATLPRYYFFFRFYCYHLELPSVLRLLTFCIIPARRDLLPIKSLFVYSLACSYCWRISNETGAVSLLLNCCLFSLSLYVAVSFLFTPLHGHLFASPLFWLRMCITFDNNIASFASTTGCYRLEVDLFCVIIVISSLPFHCYYNLYERQIPLGPLGV